MMIGIGMPISQAKMPFMGVSYLYCSRKRPACQMVPQKSDGFNQPIRASIQPEVDAKRPWYCLFSRMIRAIFRHKRGTMLISSRECGEKTQHTTNPRGVRQMSDVMQKARQGRIAALSVLGKNNRENPLNAPFGQRARSGNHHENIVFISSRANRSSVLLLG